MAPFPSACHSCGAAPLRPLLGTEHFSPISSDIRIVEGRLGLALCEACGLLQKPTDEAWRQAVEVIYRDYAINHQSGGSDPIIFNSLYGAGPRADILVKYLLDRTEIGTSGSLLDIGCASGNILRGFAQARPGWGLFGMEKSDRWREGVLSIPGVEGFFSSLEALEDRRFDLIVMSHVLEHIPGPATYLRRLLDHLTESGHLYIAVPDLRQNPIDLFVLDHCTHFDAPTLARTLGLGGFSPIALSSEILGKELVALSRRQPEGAPEASRSEPYAMGLDTVASKYVSLCDDVLTHAKTLRSVHPILGIMGSSTAAAWISGELDLNVEFFVDEDPNRFGHTAFGKPILAPAQVPQGACVFIPMSSITAEAIIARAHRPDITFSYLPWNQIDDVTARIKPVCE